MFAQRWRSLRGPTQVGILIGGAVCVPAAIYGGLLGGTLLGGWSWRLAGIFSTGLGVFFGFTFTAAAVLIVGASLGGALGASLAWLIRR